MSATVAKLQRFDAQVSAFLEACPARPSSESDPIAALLHSVPALQSLLQQNPALCREEDRAVLEHCLFDMAADGQSFEAFIEFGLWVLDRCATEGSDHFFAELNASHLTHFLNDELFRYSMLHRRHQTTLIPNNGSSWCELEWCGRQAIFCCSRCLKLNNRRVGYCSRDCQLRHWVTHKRTCGHLPDQELPGHASLNAASLDRVPSLADHQST